jgi:Domain of Unknown Function (DUF1080)
VTRIATLCLALALLGAHAVAKSGSSENVKVDGGWVALFDGKSLNGWKASDDPASFTVENGAIVVNAKGGPAHLFYEGPVQNHDFRNFELKLDIMTMPGANSGVYIHTQYQPHGWPSHGYEVQVNNSHTDPKRTGGLYGVSDVYEAPAKDNEWFTMVIKVEVPHVTTAVNGKTLVDWIEPNMTQRPPNNPDRILGSGTICLQAHDPKSTVRYKNIMIRPL